MHLTDEQRVIGKDNYNRVVGTTRREFFTNLGGATLITGVGIGAAYFGYGRTIGGDRLRVGVIGTGDEGSVLIGAINPEFIEVKAIADIRPYNLHRGVPRRPVQPRGGRGAARADEGLRLEDRGRGQRERQGLRRLRGAARPTRTSRR